MSGHRAAPRNKVQGDFPMFKLDKIDMQRIAVSAVGALILSTACVVSAVGPAYAAVPAPVLAIR